MILLFALFLLNFFIAYGLGISNGHDAGYQQGMSDQLDWDQRHNQPSERISYRPDDEEYDE